MYTPPALRIPLASFQAFRFLLYSSIRKLGCSLKASMRVVFLEGGSQAGFYETYPSVVIYKSQDLILRKMPFLIHQMYKSNLIKAQRHFFSSKYFLVFFSVYISVTSIKIYYCQMAHRLQVIGENIGSKKKFVDSSFDYMGFDSLLEPEIVEIRKQVRSFMETEIKEAIIPFVETASFPDPLIAKIKTTKLLGHFFKKPYGYGTSCMKQGIIALEAARVDPGVATFMIVQCGLLGYTIETLGSEEQKAKYLPKIINLDWIGGWGLTEDKIGSDAANLTTTVTKSKDGYKLNGIKRWMGNANKDLLIVFAKNENKKVEGYILETHNKPEGWKSEVIKNKIGLRIVQNCHITLKDVHVGEEHKLPVAKDFQTGANKILKHSRPIVCWIAVGVCIGAYDNAIKYARERQQFGKPIAAFQLVQEKLARMMGNIQAMLMLAWRIANMYDCGKAEMGQIAMAKAWITERGREVVRLSREICGGNGLLHQNYVMRALSDMEAIYTYEGSYEMNALVAGRELTGYSAFV